MWSRVKSSAPQWDPPAPETDFLAHIRCTVDSDPSISQWQVVVDNLNTHCSPSLVRCVAEVPGITVGLGIQEQYGTLQAMATRAVLLVDPSHKDVLQDTP